MNFSLSAKPMRWLFAFAFSLVQVHSVAAQLIADGDIVTLSGTTNYFTGTLTIGSNTSATELTLTGGSVVTNRTGYLGYASGSSDNLIIVTSPGSQWRHGNVTIGNAGSRNTLVVSNAGSASGGNCTMGSVASSSANVISVVGSNSIWLLTGNFSTGKGEDNFVIISNGAVAICANNFFYGNNRAVITSAGSVWSNGNLYLNSGARLVVSNGGMVFVTTSNSFASSSGPVQTSVIGVGSLLRQATLAMVGNSSSNQLIVTEGARVESVDGWLGQNGTNNFALVTGANSIWSNTSTLNLGAATTAAGNNFAISNGGTFSSSAVEIGAAGNFNQLTVTGTNSLLRVAGSLRMGFSGGSNNLITLSDSALANVGSLTFGSGAGSNALVLTNGGQLYVSNALTLGTGTVTISGGVLQADSLPSSTIIKLALNRGVLRTRTTTSSSMTRFAVGNGVDAAVWELTGNDMSTLTGGVLVKSNATLTGSGTFSNGLLAAGITLAAGATLSPGSPIGKLTFNNFLTLSNGSVTLMELNAANSTSDTLDTTTYQFTFGGTLQLTNRAGSYTNLQSFTLFQGGLRAGAFANILPVNPGAGWRWNTNGLIPDGILRVAAMPSAPPILAGLTITNGYNYTFTFSGGNAYDPCVLLAATNLSVPLSNWSRLQTNSFNASGVAQFNAASSLYIPKRFYTVQVP